MRCARCGGSTSPPKSPDLRQLGTMRGVVPGIDPTVTIAQLQRIICAARYHTDLRRNASRPPLGRIDGGHSAHCRNSSSRYGGVPAVTTLGRAGVPGSAGAGSERFICRGALAGYLPHFQALNCAAPRTRGGTARGSLRAGRSSTGETAGRGQPHPRARWTEFEEWMDMLARAGIIRSTGFTAAPFTCPREAAHACA